MEVGKIIDSQKPIRSENPFKVFLWQWQSGPNPDPWAEKDPVKMAWQNYSDDDCLIIEEAFSLNKEVADLGNYEVDFKRMVQVNKKDSKRIRRVRRREKSRFMMEMSKPVAVIKDQQTMDQSFGTVQHFLDSMMKRTPEAYGLFGRLKTLSLDSKNHEFEDIIQEIIKCIERGAEIREKIIKARIGSEVTSIINLFLDHSANLRDFLKTVLRVYTMETFICDWLNELLISHDWEVISVLSPYLVCLLYTFKRSEYIIRYQEPQGFTNSLMGIVKKQKLYLYRGVVLAKEHLNLYDPETIEYFYWKGVTSTSRDRNVAMKFIQESLTKDNSKVGVFFVIETDFGSSEDCEGMIDLYENSCSQYPDEQEVILAPGTVFKLIKTRLIEKDIYEVSLQVKRGFKETKDKVALQGPKQAILKDKRIIDGLPSQQGFKLLEMLEGNKLIRTLEIRNSGIEDHIMEEIENVRATTNMKKKDVKLMFNDIAVSSVGLLAHYYSAESLEDMFCLNRIRFKERIPKGHLEDEEFEIKSLFLGEECLERFEKVNQLKELSDNMTRANKIAHLDLTFNKGEGWRDFLQCIREFKGLQGLRLKINQLMNRESLKVLCQTIGSSKTLQQLYLELSLSEEALNCLGETLEPIVSIQKLSLDWRFCAKVSDEGLGHLRDAVRSLTSLEDLTLNFKDCKEISDEGLGYLKSGLTALKSLYSLSMSFKRCRLISDEGLKHLMGGLSSLSSLQHLSLNFGRCLSISNKGVDYLRTGLLEMKSLKHLSLSFKFCNISDESRKLLRDQLNFIREVTIRP